jgi:hypothetical protein
MRQHGRRWYRAHKQLLTVVANAQSIGKTIATYSTPEMQLTEYQVRCARRHALESFAGAPMEATSGRGLESFAGAPLESFAGTRVCISEATSEHANAYKYRHDVVSINSASFKHSSSKKMLVLRNLRAEQYRKYRKECEMQELQPLAKRIFYRLLSAPEYAQRTIEEVCCETCVEYGLELFVEAKAFARKISTYFVGGCPVLPQIEENIEAARLHNDGGVYATHCCSGGAQSRGGRRGPRAAGGGGGRR